MPKKVLVLAGSPRRNGNSSRLADEFIRGAKDAGHEAEKVCVGDLNISGCLGCSACQRNGGNCVQQDDMAEIYEKMNECDVIAFASPVYFYTWPSQMKAVIDRTFAVVAALTGKTFYLIGAGAAPREEYMAPMIEDFRKYIGCFRGEDNREGGFVFAYGTSTQGDVEGTPAMKQVYEMGKRI